MRWVMFSFVNKQVNSFHTSNFLPLKNRFFSLPSSLIVPLLNNHRAWFLSSSATVLLDLHAVAILLKQTKNKKKIEHHGHTLCKQLE